MMYLRKSLGLRLALIVICTQTILVVGWFLLWLLFSHYVSYEDVAATTAGRHVAGSIRSDATGRLSIVPTAALRAYSRTHPKLSYAAYVRGHPLTGSSPELVKAVAGRGPALPIGRIWLANGKLGYASVQEVGQDLGAAIVTSGNHFATDDIPTLLLALFAHVREKLGPAILVSILVIPMVIRRALRPLRQAASAASNIRLETLDQRLSPDGVPKEIQPFIDAINQLLERLEREVGTVQLLVGNAAHELRTPVAILSARLDSLPDDPNIRALRSDAHRLSLMVDQLLAASCAHSQSSTLSRRVDLVGLLRELIGDLAPLASRSERMIALDAGPSKVEVFGQPDALRSALANLVDNALRAEPQGGTVVVTVDIDDALASVSVIDHGPGVDHADQEQVFEPFWRRDKHWKGTGLGLAIARRIAEAHGGTIRLSDTPGGGATFQLSVARTLPDSGKGAS